MLKNIKINLILILSMFLVSSIYSYSFFGKKKDVNLLKVVAAYGNKEEIFQAFTDDTGIKVEFLDMSSGEVLARTEAEGGRPMADLWFGGGIDAFMAAKEKGLLEQHFSEEAKDISNQYKDEDGYWHGISLVTVGLIVNTDVLKEQNLPMPTKWSDLTNPIYKEEILMSDPAISGTNYALINSFFQALGEEKAIELFKGIVNNTPYLAKRGSEPPKKANLGEVAIGIAPLTGPALYYDEKYPVEGVFLEDAIPWVPAGMAVFKNADNLGAAKKFIDWSLSERGQKMIQSVNARIMVRSNLDIPEKMKGVNLGKLMRVDFSKFGSQRNEILKIWQNEVLK